MSNDLAGALVELEHEKAIELAGKRLQSGEDPLAILQECQQGMTRVGELFQECEYFLSELILSAEIFKEIAATLEPYLQERQTGPPRGKVLLATMRGDIHDLGKDLFATLLHAHGFEIHDLGVNVEPTALLQGVEEVRPDFVGFSALITTCFDASRNAAELLREAGLREDLKLMVGGGVTSPSFRDYIGADFQTLDAAEGVEYCLAHTSEAQ